MDKILSSATSSSSSATRPPYPDDLKNQAIARMESCLYAKLMSLDAFPTEQAACRPLQ